MVDEPGMKDEGTRKRRRSGEAWTFPDTTIWIDGSGPAQLGGPLSSYTKCEWTEQILEHFLTEGQTA